MSGRIIALDFDDTLVRTHAAMDLWLTKSGHGVVDWSNYITFSPDILDAYHGSETPETTLAMPGAFEACKTLSRDDRLFIVTFRHDRHLEGTKKLADALFPGMFEDVLCTGNFGSKLATLEHLGAVVLVDDSPRHVAEAEAAGLSSILFGDTPWNHDVAHIRRALNWNVAEPMIEQILAEVGAAPAP